MLIFDGGHGYFKSYSINQGWTKPRFFERVFKIFTDLFRFQCANQTGTQNFDPGRTSTPFSLSHHFL